MKRSSLPTTLFFLYSREHLQSKNSLITNVKKSPDRCFQRAQFSRHFKPPLWKLYSIKHKKLLLLSFTFSFHHSADFLSFVSIWFLILATVKVFPCVFLFAKWNKQLNELHAYGKVSTWRRGKLLESDNFSFHFSMSDFQCFHNELNVWSGHDTLNERRFLKIFVKFSGVSCHRVSRLSSSTNFKSLMEFSSSLPTSKFEI